MIPPLCGNHICSILVLLQLYTAWFLHIHFSHNSFIYLFVFMLSGLVPNHQTACAQVPLNMLIQTHNASALCCCNDFSLPPLIKCFAKLLEKYFPFDSQKILGEDREKQCFQADLFSSSPSPALDRWLCGWRPGPYRITTYSRILSLVISASDRSSLWRSRILVTIPAWGACHVWDV